MNRPKIIITSDTELWHKDMLLDKNVITPIKHFSMLSQTYDVPINIFLAAYDFKSEDFNEPFIDSWPRLAQIIDGNFSIQLHLHTRGIINNNDRFGELTETEKDRALDFAKRKVIDIFGKTPNSFRAGGYRIGDNILRSFDILAKHNIKYDFSIAPNKIIPGGVNYRNVDLELIANHSSVTPIPLPTNKDGRIFSCERLNTRVVYDEIKNYEGEYFVLDFHSFFVHQSSGKRIVSLAELFSNTILNKINKLLDTRIYFQSKAYRDFKELIKKLKNENFTFVNLDKL